MPLLMTSGTTPVIPPGEIVLRFMLCTNDERIFFRVLEEHPAVVAMRNFNFRCSTSGVNIRASAHPAIGDGMTLYLRGDDKARDRDVSVISTANPEQIKGAFLEALVEFAQCFRAEKEDIGCVIGVDDIYQL